MARTKSVIFFTFLLAACGSPQKEYGDSSRDPSPVVLPTQDDPQRSTQGVRLPEEYPSRQDCTQIMGAMRAQCDLNSPASVNENGAPLAPPIAVE